MLCLLSSADKGISGLILAQQRWGEVKQMIPHVMFSRQAVTGALHALAGRHASAGIQMQAGSSFSACLMGQAGACWA